MIRSLTTPRPQLTVDELLQLKWLLGGVLTIVSVATVAYMDVDAWLLMGLAIGTSLAMSVRPTLPARIPRLVHLLAFPFIAAFFALDLWLRSELLPAMVRLDILLLLYRAVVYRQRRDDLQVIVLGLFLVVVAGVLTVSLAFAAQILVYTAFALAFLLVSTLADAATGGRSRSGGPAGAGARRGAAGSGAPAWAVQVNWRRLLRRVRAVVDWRVVVVTGTLFLGVIATTALLFVSIPRFQLDNGMFLERFITTKARTGFSDTIHFGDVTAIQQDTSVALHVDVSDPGQIPLSPYWRMLVLDDYTDGTFQLSPRLRAQSFLRSRTAVRTTGGARGGRNARWTFYLEAGVSRYLPLLGAFRLLRFGEAQRFRNAPGLGLLALARDPVSMTAYQVQGFDLSTPLRDPPGDDYTGLVKPSSESAAQAAADNAELRRLAVAAAGRAPLTAADFAARVCAWLRRRHGYSLNPRIPAGPGDPLVRWVASRASGHCELFAGSFVMLARAAGYPARIVTGFRGGEWNGFSNSFTVRNSDAHAWAEIYDRASGSWLRADPLAAPVSPVPAAGHARVGPVDRSWAARWDSLRVFWYRRIVNFDQQAQVHAFRSAKDAAKAAGRELRRRLGRWAAALESWWRAPWDVRRVGGLLALAVGALLLARWWRRLRVRLLQHPFWRPRGRRDDPVRREAGRWLQRLAGSPPAPDALPVCAELQRLRFGHRATWPDPADVFRRARQTAWRARECRR